MSSTATIPPDATSPEAVQPKAGAKPSLMASVMSSLKGMLEVEQIITRSFQSEAPALSQISQYLFSLGGKRIRPILALMSGKLFGLVPPSAPLMDVAAGIELIHMATLLHDDIIDKSPIRRHQQSPFARFGADSTLLAGDFLLTRAFRLCASLDEFIITRTEIACVALTEGEILETPLHLANHTRESSLTISRKKTAALFILAAESGAHLAGAGVGATEAMRLFGEKLGVAFQVLDDVLDIASDQDLLGKKTGLDLLERKPSIVNVLLLQSAHPVAQMLSREPATSDEAFINAELSAIRALPELATAREIARALAAEAQQHLDDACRLAPQFDAETKAQLQGLIAFTLQRLS